MKNFNTYILEKLVINKDSKPEKNELKQAYDIIVNMLSKSEYECNVFNSGNKIHVDFFEVFSKASNEPGKIIGYILKELRAAKLNIGFERGKYPKSSGGREWVSFFKKTN